VAQRPVNPDGGGRRRAESAESPPPTHPGDRTQPSYDLAQDGTLWRRSDVISSRRLDQIPDPGAEASPGITPPDPLAAVLS
jgi:hypothetical protein